MKPITQQLRDVERTYIMAGTDHVALLRARNLITEIWVLAQNPDKDLRKELKGLLAEAGMELNERTATENTPL